MVIEIENSPERLNGLLDGIIGGILSPKTSTTTNEAEQLSNEIYYQQQEINSLKSSKATITYVAAGLGLAAAFLGYKLYKK